MRRTRATMVSLAYRKTWTAAVVAFLSLLPVAISATEPVSPRLLALQKLRDAGISQELMEVIRRKHDETERDRIVALNVLGFMYRANYSVHDTPEARKKCRQFLRLHRRDLTSAEKRYGVSKEAIAALLWVETKLGRMLGRTHISHVLFSIVQADHPDVIKATLAEMDSRQPQPTPEDRQKAIERSTAKAEWALSELKSLDTVLKENPRMFRHMNGSYAGAFGIPQFLPSSYLKWGAARRAGRAANLFDVRDAIHSVAHYLSANGWKNGDREAQKAALFHYNRSIGYGEVILKLAAEL